MLRMQIYLPDDLYEAVKNEQLSASGPHIHRHKTLRIKLTENQVEIFLDLERLAVHPRCRMKSGQRIKIQEHFPPNSDAYYEATPQRLLSQSRFIHANLHALFIELFNEDVFAHTRRAMGLVSACTKEISLVGHELASVRIAAAIAAMRRYKRIRVPYFKDLLAQARKQSMNSQAERDIVRKPGNPMLWTSRCPLNRGNSSILRVDRAATRPSGVQADQSIHQGPELRS